MSASIPSCRSPAAVTAYVLFLLLKAQADQYYIPGTSLETSKWSDKFTVDDVSSFYFNVPDPAIEVLSPKGFRVTYIGKYLDPHGSKSSVARHITADYGIYWV